MHRESIRSRSKCGVRSTRRRRPTAAERSRHELARCARLSQRSGGVSEVGWRGRRCRAPPNGGASCSPTWSRALFEAFDATYGYRRIHAELVRAGERVGPELVRKLMREMDLIPVQPRPFRTTTEPDPDAPDTVDLVKRDFTAQRPGTKVVGDITYIRTWQGCAVFALR